MFRSFALLVIGVSICTSAQAFTLEPRAMACMMYFRSDAVFVGQVIATKAVPEQGDDEGGRVYTLKVIKSYLGADQPTIDVFTPNDSGRLRLDLGKKYLLFASKGDARLTIGYDRISAALPTAKQVLKDLEKILTRKPGDGGDVYARVVRRPFDENSGGVGGVSVVVRGDKGTFDATTNGKGWIHLHVPAGQYSAKATAAGMSFEPYDLTWDDPDHFSVRDGSCAESLIIEKP